MTKAITKKLREKLPHRPPLTADELKHRYPWMVTGSLKGAGNNRTVSIRCQHPGCKRVRRTRTQDLFQVRFCKPHQRERDVLKSRERRKRWRKRDAERRRAMREGEP
jgi:hypothetical protein